MARRELTKEELRAVQLTELELLKEVDRICKKSGITYNIIAGTLLGAVRHGGFIPWDDDADVAMLRPEYERFVRACGKELDRERFYFQDMDVTPGYRWGYGKLRKKNTLFLREHQEHMPYGQGIFIDIFPLDGVPDFRPMRALKNFECFCVRKILWSEVGKYADKSRGKRAWFGLLSRIPEKAVKGYLRNLIRRANRKETKYVRILMFPTPNRTYGYLRDWYLHSRDYVFEGVSFRGIRDFDAYLSFKFGSYLVPPPERERKVHPVSGLKVDNHE